MDDLDALRAEQGEIEALLVALHTVARCQSQRLQDVQQQIRDYQVPSTPVPSAAPAIVQRRPSELQALHLWVLQDVTHIWRGGKPVCGVAAPITDWTPYTRDLRGWVDVCATCHSYAAIP